MTNEERRERIEELMDIGNLSRWETSFLISAAAQLDRGWNLTEGQQKKLDEIIEAKGK